MIKVEVNEKDIRAVTDRCNRIAGIFTDGKLYDKISQVLLGKVQERFLKQENADGSKWAPSLAAKMRQAGIPVKGSDNRYYTGGATYYASGSLFRSLGIMPSGPTERSIGTSYYVAGELHDKDGRQIVGSNDNDMKLMTNVIMERLNNV